jgi:hypothetical protein
MEIETTIRSIKLSHGPAVLSYRQGMNDIHSVFTNSMLVFFKKAQILRNENYTEELFMNSDCDKCDRESELDEHCSSRFNTNRQSHVTEQETYTLLEVIIYTITHWDIISKAQ